MGRGGHLQENDAKGRKAPGGFTTHKALALKTRTPKAVTFSCGGVRNRASM